MFLVIGGLCAALVMPLRAGTPVAIFDNSVNDLVNRFNVGVGREVGDEIILANVPQRWLTQFDFEYWGVSGLGPGQPFAGTVQARVRFYQNTGPLWNGYYAEPGSTPFYDSLWFGGFTPTDVAPFRATLVFTAGSDFPTYGLPMPVESNMTWTVEFRGLGAGDSVGVDLYSPPVVGQDYPDYWENVGGGGWRLLTNNAVAMDFAARMYADIPEPSSLMLSVLGGLGILTAIRWLRQAK